MHITIKKKEKEKNTKLRVLPTSLCIFISSKTRVNTLFFPNSLKIFQTLSFAHFPRNFSIYPSILVLLQTFLRPFSGGAEGFIFKLLRLQVFLPTLLQKGRFSVLLFTFEVLSFLLIRFCFCAHALAYLFA